MGIGTGNPILKFNVIESNQGSYTLGSSPLNDYYPSGTVFNLSGKGNSNGASLIIFETLTSSGGNQQSFIGAVKEHENINSGTAIVFGSRTGATSWGENMRIDSSRNVGIGTSSPAEKLEVLGGHVLIKGNTSNDIYPSLILNRSTASGNNPGSGRIIVGHSNQNTYSGKIMIEPIYYDGSSYVYRENTFIVDASGKVLMPSLGTGTGTVLSVTSSGEVVKDSTVTQQGNLFNAANQLVKLDGTGNLNVKGTILQVVHVEKSNIFSTSSTSYVTITGLSGTITPKYSNSKILLMWTIVAGSGNYKSSITQAYRGSTAILLGDSVSGAERASAVNMYVPHDTKSNKNISIVGIDTPNSTSAQTYSLKIKSPQGGTFRVNDLGSGSRNQVYSQTSRSSLIIMEIGG